MALYKQEGSPFWYYDIHHAGQRLRESTGTTDRKEAQRIHDEKKAELHRLTPKIKGRTWGNAVEAWLNEKDRSESDLLSLKKYATYYPDRLLTKVDGDGIERALREFCKTPGTYTRYRTTIRAILHVAQDRGWLREVPKVPVWKERKKSRSYEWLTHEQWEQLYSELPPHQQRAAQFSILTGLRQENVLGLEWSRVDLDRELVWIEGEDAKGDEAISVPLSSEAVALLKHIRTLEKGVDFDEEYVFVRKGERFSEIKTAFIAACIRAKLGNYDDKGHYRGFKWHGLRHTWATWHVQNGTPLDVLQKLGAWKDARMLQIYAHHAPSHLARFAGNTTKKD